MVPEQPGMSVVGWAWSSCPSAGLMNTLLQLTVPPCASVTVIVYGTCWPNSSIPPLTGVVMVTTGALLPTVIGIDANAVRPVLSETRSWALKFPLAVYVNDGFAAEESHVPLPSKSHEYEIVLPGSGSIEPELENWTVSGARPFVGLPAA